MKYGKITNGELMLAPNRIEKDGAVTYNPSAEMLAEEGYLPITESPMPESEEGKRYIPHYEESEGEIVCVWEECEIPEEVPTPEPTPADKLAELEAKIEEYNEANQLAIAELAEALMGGAE